MRPLQVQGGRNETMDGSMKFYKPSLDGLRAFAFVCILVHHVDLPAGGVFKAAVPDLALQKLSEFGWIGVDIFLCLSSFLLTKLLMIEYNKEGRVSVRYFHIRRVLRILPLYYVYLALAFGVLPSLGWIEPGVGNPVYVAMLEKHLLPYFALLGNWSVGLFGFPEGRVLGHMWTISLEQQFYLILPLVLKWTVFGCKRQNAFLSLGLLLGLTILIRFALYRFTVPHPFIWVNTFTRLDPFIVGIAIALMPESVLVNFCGRFPEGVLFLTGLFSFLLVCLFPNVNHVSVHINWQYPLVAVGAGLALISVLYDDFWRRAFSLSPLVFIGKISYGCYVYHVLAIRLMQFGARELDNNAFSESQVYLLKLFLSLAITLCAAAISYFLFEKKVLLFKLKFTRVGSRPI